MDDAELSLHYLLDGRPLCEYTVRELDDWFTRNTPSQRSGYVGMSCEGCVGIYMDRMDAIIKAHDA